MTPVENLRAYCKRKGPLPNNHAAIKVNIRAVIAHVEDMERALATTREYLEAKGLLDDFVAEMTAKSVAG